MATLRRSHEDESGAVAVIVTLLLVVLLGFSAFAIDLGALRADRAMSQTAADMATAAAVQVYDGTQPGSALDACLEARSFAELNLGVSLVAASGQACEDVFPSTGACSPSWTPSSPDLWQPAVYVGGPYTVIVTAPVFDGDPLMGTEVYATDGGHCDRISVRVERTRDFVFAPVGVGQTDGRTSVGAVGMAQVTEITGRIASLVVLERIATDDPAIGGCSVLVTTGSPDTPPRGIRVGTDTIPGHVTVDSEVPACGNKAIRIEGANAIIRTTGLFESQALLTNPSNPDVYDPGKLTSTTTDGLPQLTQPVAGPKVTRSVVDHVYNCLDPYPLSPGFDQRWSPATTYPAAEVQHCTEGGPAYIRDLHNALKDVAFTTPTERAAAQAAGWGIIAPSDGDLTCTGGGTPPVRARWYVECDPWVPQNLVLNDVDVVVLRGQISLDGSNRSLTIRGGSRGGVLYTPTANGRVRVVSSNVLTLDRTFAYLHDTRLETEGQAGVVLRAPLESNSVCATVAGVGAPSGGCFAPLVIWSNTSQTHTLAGGGQFTVVGSYFAPNALIDEAGGSAKDLLDAQFFARRFKARGGGQIFMVPNPDTNIVTSTEREAGLIR
jgi:hypothetical protein